MLSAMQGNNEAQDHLYTLKQLLHSDSAILNTIKVVDIA